MILFPLAKCPEWNCYIYISIFTFFGEPPYYFSQWLHQFTFLPTVHKIAPVSATSPILAGLPGRVLLVSFLFLFFPFSSLNISCNFLWPCEVAAEKSLDSLMKVALYVTNCFSLAPFRIFFLPLTFDNLNILYLGMHLFEFSLLGTL